MKIESIHRLVGCAVAIGLLFTFTSFFCSVACGTAIYYVDSEHGQDIFDGLSPERAWKTIARINRYAKTIGFQNGDTVLFKRNCRWSNDETLGNDGSQIKFHVNGFTIADYGEGTLPHFDGNTQRPIHIVDPTLSNLNIINIDISGDAWHSRKDSNIVISGVQDVTIDGIYMNGHFGNKYLGKSGIYLGGCEGSIVIRNCFIYNCGPEDIPTTGTDYTGIVLDNIQHGNIVIENNTVHDVNSDCLMIHKCSVPCLITGNILYNGGENSIDCKSSSHITIKANKIFRKTSFIGTGGSNTSGGSILAIHDPYSQGNVQDIVVEFNYLSGNDKPAMNVVDIAKGCTISENQFYGPSRGINLKEGAIAVVVKENTFIDVAGCISIGNDTEGIDIHNNLILNPKIITIPNRSYTTGGISENNSKGPNKIHHNTIVNQTGSCKCLVSIITSAGSEIYANVLYQALSGEDVFLLYVAPYGQIPLVDANCYFNPNSPNRIFFFNKLFQQTDFAAWKAQHPGDCFCDPLFVDADRSNYELRKESPCINRGSSITTPGPIPPTNVRIIK